MIKIWFEKYKTVVIGIIVVVLAIIFFVSKPEEEGVAGNEVTFPVENKDGEIHQEDDKEEIVTAPSVIYVDVKGAVKAPGLYQAKEGERVMDAIRLAGGLLGSADEKQINFALKLHDEMVIYVPPEGEMADQPPLLAGATPAVEAGEGKVNINRADLAELETLAGIGPAKAQAIIDYREQQGPFKTIEDLKNVSGIGEKTFEKLQESITVN